MNGRTAAPDNTLPRVIGAAALGLAAITGLAALGLRADWLLREGGPVESASAVLLLCAALLLMAGRPRRTGLSRWRIPVLLMLLAARELDFDKRFTEMGLLKLRLYTSEGMVGTKVAGLVLIVVLVAIVYGLIRYGYPSLRDGLRRRAGWALFTSAGIVAAVISKSIDGLNRKLEDFGMTASAETVVVAAATEETLELAFAALMVMAVTAWLRATR